MVYVISCHRVYQHCQVLMSHVCVISCHRVYQHCQVLMSHVCVISCHRVYQHCQVLMSVLSHVMSVLSLCYVIGCTNIAKC